MPACGVCLKTTGSREAYHADCLEKLFGVRSLPSLGDIELRTLLPVGFRNGRKNVAFRSAGKGLLGPVAGPTRTPDIATRRSIHSQARACQVSLGAAERTCDDAHGRFGGHRNAAFWIAMAERRLAGLCDQTLRSFGRRHKIARRRFLSAWRNADAGQVSRSAANNAFACCESTLPNRLLKPASFLKISLFSWWVANGDHHLKNLSSLDRS